MAMRNYSLTMHPTSDGKVLLGLVENVRTHPSRPAAAGLVWRIEHRMDDLPAALEMAGRDVLKRLRSDPTPGGLEP